MARKGRAKSLTEKEFKIVEAVILTKTNAKRNRAILYMSFGLGLRACEIRGLTLRDVLQDDMETLKEDINLKRTKGNKPRWIYFVDAKIVKVLQDHLREMKSFCLRKNITFSPDLPLFMSQKGGFFNPDRMVALFLRFYRQAGIHDAKSHSGRVSFATNHINNGCDIALVSSLLGHTTIEMTMRYYRDDPNRAKKILQKGMF